MSLFKSALDGIGTAAGVAWPLFGIASTSLCIVVGGGPAMIFGSFCLGLFCMVFGITAYFAYQQTQTERKDLKKRFKDKENKCVEKLYDFIRKLVLEYQTGAGKSQEELIDQLQKKLLAKTENGPPLFIPVLKELACSKTRLSTLVANLNDIEHMRIPLKELLDLHRSEPPQLSWQQTFKSLSFGFTATFGSIAGCSAGLSGVLSSLNLFSGFQTVPIIGWGILGVATLFGTIMAYVSIVKSQRMQAISTGINYYKSLNKEIKAVIKSSLSLLEGVDYNSATTTNGRLNNASMPLDASSKMKDPKPLRFFSHTEIQTTNTEPSQLSQCLIL